MPYTYPSTGSYVPPTGGTTTTPSTGTSTSERAGYTVNPISIVKTSNDPKSNQITFSVMLPGQSAAQQQWFSSYQEAQAYVTDFYNKTAGGAVPPGALAVSLFRGGEKNPNTGMPWGYETLPKGVNVSAGYTDAQGRPVTWQVGQWNPNTPFPTFTPGTEPEGYGTGGTRDGSVDEVDPNNFQYPHYQENRDDINSRLTDTRNRTAPQIGYQTRDPYRETTFTPWGESERASSGRLGTVAGFEPATMGGYSRASGAGATAGIAKDVKLGPLERAQDSEVRKNLMEGLDYQGRLMRGEDSVAAKQMARDQEYAISAQMGMARAARPGLAAMANRDAALNTGRLQADFGSRLAQAQLQERNEAAQRYAQYGGMIREQDNTLGMFNAGEGNKYNIAQGGISKDIGISNAANQTQASIASAANATQASIANAKNSLDAAIKAGDWVQAARLEKFIQDNENVRTQGKLDTDTNIANMRDSNLWRTNENTTRTNVDLANTEGYNKYTGEDRDYMTGVDKSNAELALQSQRNADLMEESLMRLRHDIDSGQQSGAMAYEDLLSKYGLVAMKGEIDKILTQMGIDARKALEPKTWERVLSAVVPILATFASKVPAMGGGGGGGQSGPMSDALSGGWTSSSGGGISSGV